MKDSGVMCPRDGYVVFRQSELLTGRLGKVTLGGSNKSGLFQVCFQSQGMPHKRTLPLALLTAKESAMRVSMFGAHPQQCNCVVCPVCITRRSGNDSAVISETSILSCSMLPEQVLASDFSPQAAAAVMRRLSKWSARFIGERGFSIGVDDVIPLPRLSQEVADVTSSSYEACQVCAISHIGVCTLEMALHQAGTNNLLSWHQSLSVFGV